MSRPAEEKLVELLKENAFTVSTAESCTGGLVSATIINVSGASDVTCASIVTYSNDAKRKYLGVKRSTLESRGAVSKQCAKQMACGITKQTGADVGISTTGIAGPSGGTAEKPVGLVYIGCCVRGNTKVKKFIFEGDRTAIRQQAVEAALKLAKKCIRAFTETKKNEQK